MTRSDSEVAELLGISLGRLRNKLCAGNPLPPRIEPPGCRHRLWPCQAVHDWLEQFTISVVDRPQSRQRTKTSRPTDETRGTVAPPLSIVAMNWAWRQALTPTLKLVLMALADAADDQGVCWPSVSTLAKKCTVSTRTVQRSLRVLIDSGLLIAEARQRRDGSSTSNRYRLLIAGGDNLSPPREAGDTRPGQGCRGDPDVPVTPGTTNRIVIDPPQPGAGDEQRIDSADRRKW